MFCELRAVTEPTSSMPNPHCMKKTSAPFQSSHHVSAAMGVRNALDCGARGAARGAVSAGADGGVGAAQLVQEGAAGGTGVLELLHDSSSSTLVRFMAE